MNRGVVIVSLCFSSLFAAMAPANAALVAHWSFEGANALDSSGNGHHGVLQDGAAFSLITPGAFSTNSVEVFGLGDRVFTVPIQNFGLGTGDFTIVGFVFRLTMSTVDELFGDGIDLSVQIADFVGPPPNAVQASLGGAPVVDGNAILNDNMWHQVAVRRAGGMLDVVVDGLVSPAVANNFDLDTVPVGQVFSIGSFTPVSPGHVGFIDDVAIFDEALSLLDLADISVNGVSPAAIPAPAPLALMAGLALLAWCKRR